MYGDPDEERIWCAWEACDNPASSLHAMVECMARRSPHGEHPRRPECRECRRIAFCSAAHMDYYEHSHVPGRYGRLSPGVNRNYV